MRAFKELYNLFRTELTIKIMQTLIFQNCGCCTSSIQFFSTVVSKFCSRLEKQIININVISLKSE